MGAATGRPGLCPRAGERQSASRRREAVLKSWRTRSQSGEQGLTFSRCSVNIC